MISGLQLGTELKRFNRFKLSRIALIIVALMPILYSTLYLWSYWNPFGQIDRVPVALVNSDRGATVEGKKLEAGKQVADGLLEDKSLNWQKVSHQEAIDGVREGRYYFAVELPEDFSEAIASPAQKENPQPKKATLQATYNDANGYLSTMIGENAMRVVINVVGEKIGSQAVDKLLVGLLDAGTGIMRAADGSEKLSTGIGKLYDGSGELSDGLHKAKDGTAQLADGTDRLVDGTGQLKDGSSRLADGTDQLADGVDQLAAGVGAAAGTINDVQGKANALRTQVDSFGQRVSTATSQVSQLEAIAREASSTQGQSAQEIRNVADTLASLPDPASQNAARRLNALADQFEKQGLGPQSDAMAKVNEVTGGVRDLNYQFNDPNSDLRGAFTKVSDGIAKFGQLQDGVNRLQDGAHQLRDGAHQLDNGIGQLQDGAVQLQDGSHQLRDGSVKLSDGADRLHDGLAEARDGSKELSTGLRDGANSVPTWTPTQRQDIASVMGGPVQVSDHNDAGNNTFGAGLAPFFFALALYIGAILMFLLINPIQRRAIASGISPLRAAVAGFLSPAVIGIAQTFAVVGLTLLATPLHASTIVGLFVFGILVSLVYVAFNQMFLMLLTPGPGRVASMAFLMIQVVASGGLYPIETEPKFLQWIHPFMPMKYAVDGFRQVLYGDFDARIVISIVALLAFTAFALAITTWSAARDRTWTMKRLHPAIQI
nr:YhgE/Pip domain-containing protein [Corynebacterium lactis]